MGDNREELTGDALRWWYRLRRGFGVPDVVPDDMARQVVRRRLADDLSASELHEIYLEQRAQQMVDAAVELAADGTLLDGVLPVELVRFAGTEGGWTPALRIVTKSGAASAASPSTRDMMTATAELIVDALRAAVGREQLGAEHRREFPSPS